LLVKEEDRVNYTGICCACFEPIHNEQPFQFRAGGRKFHRRCSERTNNYYIRLEKRLAERLAKQLAKQGGQVQK